MRNSMLYQLSIDDYQAMMDATGHHENTCQDWQGWTAAMVDARHVTRSTVDGWPCPSCNRKGCAGDVVTLPVPFAVLPSRVTDLRIAA